MNTIKDNVIDWVHTFEKILNDTKYEIEKNEIDLMRNDSDVDISDLYESYIKRFPKELTEWGVMDFCCMWPEYGMTLVEPKNKPIVATADIFKRVINRVEDSLPKVYKTDKNAIINQYRLVQEKRYMIYAEMTSLNTISEIRARVKVMLSFFNQKPEWIRYHNWYFITQDDLFDIFDRLTVPLE